MVCGDLSQVPQEASAAVHTVQAVSSVPIFGLIAWQAKNLVRGVKELKHDMVAFVSRKQRKK